MSRKCQHTHSWNEILVHLGPSYTWKISLKYRDILHQIEISLKYRVYRKHRKNCECCHHHSVFKGHNVIVHIVVLNCQKCNQCLKCQVSGHKNFQKIWKLSKNLKTFQKSENFSKIWKLLRNLKTFKKSENFLKI